MIRHLISAVVTTILVVAVSAFGLFAVAAAVVARYPQAKIAGREHVTRGSVTTYELVLSGAKVKAATLSPDGHWISPKLAK